MDLISIFWFRRDLRWEDNVGLFQALNGKNKVLPLFIFDTDILSQLEDLYDRRVDYIYQSVYFLKGKLQKRGSDLAVEIGSPLEIFKKLSTQFSIQAIYCNEDYEPKAIARDRAVHDFFISQNIPFYSFKDQVIFAKNEICKKDQSPYSIYTPYAKQWKEKLATIDLFPLKMDDSQLYHWKADAFSSLSQIGFEKTDMVFEVPKLNVNIISQYELTRDLPAKQGTTQLGIALRFGTISIRACVRFAIDHNAVWLGELIWREFFMQILYHFPAVENACFKKEYESIPWRNDETQFEKWCHGETGYPLVDAGMRQLNTTGWMHNRVRMVVASFLTKHLLIDWRWGEAYFAKKLLDYDLSANNGNWQWAASCGCDAVPYFRIFNPTTQLQKFDPQLIYVKKWIADWDHYLQTVQPIVAHDSARKRAIETYKQALAKFRS